MSVSMINVTPAALKEMLDEQTRTLREEIAVLRAQVTAARTATGGESKGKKEKKIRDPDAPKRPPNDWILFTQRVEKIIKDVEDAAGIKKEERMKTVVAKQFASDLKGRKPYADWAEEEIKAALADWSPPEHSKQELAGKSKRKSGSETGSEAGDGESLASGTNAAAEKPKRVLTEEQKAKMKAGREAAKAKKEAEKAAAPTTAEVPAPVGAAPKKVAIKPKAAEVPKKVDLRFYAWSHEGQEYFTNDRGDVVTTEFEWVGRYDGKTIDTAVPEPADLAEAEMRE